MRNLEHGCRRRDRTHSNNSNHTTRLDDPHGRRKGRRETGSINDNIDGLVGENIANFLRELGQVCSELRSGVESVDRFLRCRFWDDARRWCVLLRRRESGLGEIGCADMFGEDAKGEETGNRRKTDGPAADNDDILVDAFVEANSGPVAGIQSYRLVN